MEQRDGVRRSVRAGRLVLVEEVARDGAQGRTLLDARQRITIAREQARIFGPAAAERLIFVAGFPPIGPEEVDVVRRVCAEVDVCQLQTLCRARRADIAQSLELAGEARFGRTLFVAPASPAMSRAMLHSPPSRALDQACDLLAFAVDRAGDVAVDVCLADIGRADPGHLAESCNRLTRGGAATIMLADTVGCLYPHQLDALLTALLPRLEPQVVVHLHLHDDLGLALANALVALRHGVRMFTAAWRGLGERAGLLATERLLATLGLADGREGRAAIGHGLFDPPLDLTRIVPLAQTIGDWLDLAPRTCEPYVGSGVNTVATGTPFIDPPTFRPYDPARLGLPTLIALTHLASARLVTRVAAEMGLALDLQAARRAMAWVKAEAYRQGRAEVDRAAFLDFLQRDGVGA